MKPSHLHVTATATFNVEELLRQHPTATFRRMAEDHRDVAYCIQLTEQVQLRPYVYWARWTEDDYELVEAPEAEGMGLKECDVGPNRFRLLTPHSFLLVGYVGDAWDSYRPDQLVPVLERFATKPELDAAVAALETVCSHFETFYFGTVGEGCRFAARPTFGLVEDLFGPWGDYSAYGREQQEEYDAANPPMRHDPMQTER